MIATIISNTLKVQNESMYEKKRKGERPTVPSFIEEEPTKPKYPFEDNRTFSERGMEVAKIIYDTDIEESRALRLILNSITEGFTHNKFTIPSGYEYTESTNYVSNMETYRKETEEFLVLQREYEEAREQYPALLDAYLKQEEFLERLETPEFFKLYEKENMPILLLPTDNLNNHNYSLGSMHLHMKSGSALRNEFLNTPSDKDISVIGNSLGVNPNQYGMLTELEMERFLVSIDWKVVLDRLEHEDYNRYWSRLNNLVDDVEVSPTVSPTVGETAEVVEVAEIPIEDKNLDEVITSDSYLSADNYLSSDRY